MAGKLSITVEQTEQIAQLVELGCYREQACGQAGVSSRSLRRWITQAEIAYEKGLTAESSPYIAFAEKILLAEAKAENRNVATIQGASKADWRAAAWWLEKKNPARWGDRVRQEVQAMVEQLIGDLKVGLDPDVFEQVLLVIARSEVSGQHGTPLSVRDAWRGHGDAEEGPETEH